MIILSYLLLGNYFFKGVSYFMGNLIFFHDILLSICYFVVFFIFCFMFRVMVFSGQYLYNLGNMKLEIVWTVVPVLILLRIVEPSLYLLYLSESFSFKKGQILKVIGHQWYWSYNSDLINSVAGESVDYDSFMCETQNLVAGDFRLLEVDLPAVVWANVPVFFLVTSADVIHSFALPALGIKIDAFPGRLNVGVSSGLPVGCYWGQCSEICGANHAFMPIGLERIL